MLAERQHDEAAAGLDVGGVGVERESSGARFAPQQEADRRADRGVGEAGQRLGRRDDVPDAAEVGERDQQRRLVFGAPQRAFELVLVVVAARGDLFDQRRQRVFGRRREQTREPVGVLGDQRPEKQRMVGDPEQQRARRLGRGERRQRFGARVAQQRFEPLVRHAPARRGAARRAGARQGRRSRRRLRGGQARRFAPPPAGSQSP